MRRALITPAQCERLRRLCDVHPTTVAAEIVGVSTSSVRKLRARGWRPAECRRPQRPRPSDFAIQCDAMTKKQLCIHYAAGDECVRRWCREVARANQVPRRTGMAIVPPDGSPDALKRHGERGTPTALAQIVARAGPYGAAEIYGVSYGTLKKWRRALGLSISWSRQPVARRSRSTTLPSQIGWVDRRYGRSAGRSA